MVKELNLWRVQLFMILELIQIFFRLDVNNLFIFSFHFLQRSLGRNNDVSNLLSKREYSYSMNDPCFLKVDFIVASEWHGIYHNYLNDLEKRGLLRKMHRHHCCLLRVVKFRRVLCWKCRKFFVLTVRWRLEKPNFRYFSKGNRTFLFRSSLWKFIRAQLFRRRIQ